MALHAKIEGQKDSVKLRTYNFPTRGNQPEDFHLIVDGEKLGTDRVRTTGGGGKTYTYIKTKDQDGTNQSYWLEGALAAGTKITLEEVETKAEAKAKAKEAAAEADGAPAANKTPAPAPKAPAAPAKPAPQRPAATKKK